jgi:hypothetical protein
MKKSKYLLVLGLLLLLVIVLTGCGGGSGGGNGDNSTIHFTMPSIYYTSKDYSSGDNIPSGKTVKFYTLKEIPGTTINADYTFSGTTGNSDLTFKLPDFLINQTRYIYAIVILKGTFDLKGKTEKDLLDAINNNEILYGKTDDEQPVSLTKGGTISNVIFFGKP